MQKVKYLICIITGVLIGVFLLQVIENSPSHTVKNEIKPNSQQERHPKCGEDFELISQHLECDKETDLNSDIIPFQDKLETIKDEAIKNKKALEISVYFRDLNNGPWFGTDIDKSFTPASLFKLPIAMSIYRANEHRSGILEQKITYDKPIEAQASQNIIAEKTAEIGKTYTVAELIEKMLIYSDNTSTVLLSNALQNQVDFDKIFIDLGIELDKNNPEEIKISSKSFAALYRMLYNASYLNKNDSETILKILTRSKEEKTLFAGVPDSVPIAAKFGERAYTNTNQKYLHNCGIIYYPKHPYLLCIMTKGTNQNDQASVIEKLSKAIYEELNYQYQNQSLTQPKKPAI